MACVSEEILKEVIDRIVKEVHPETIIMFGSQATNTATVDSDLDLVVVDPEPFGPNHGRVGEITQIEQALSGVPIATDILLYSRDELNKWRDSSSHILSRALRQGRVIYGHA
jgi:predicted nucleotidyltransferase